MDLLLNFGIEPPVTQERFETAKADDIVNETYTAVEQKYNQRKEAIRGEAFPVIRNIFENNTQGFTNIAVPFSDGRKTIQIAVGLEKAYKTNGDEIVDSLEKGITLAMIDQQWKEHLRD